MMMRHDRIMSDSNEPHSLFSSAPLSLSPFLPLSTSISHRLFFSVSYSLSLCLSLCLILLLCVSLCLSWSLSVSICVCLSLSLFTCFSLQSQAPAINPGQSGGREKAGRVSPPAHTCQVFHLESGSACPPGPPRLPELHAAGGGLGICKDPPVPNTAEAAGRVSVPHLPQPSSGAAPPSSEKS